MKKYFLTCNYSYVNIIKKIFYNAIISWVIFFNSYLENVNFDILNVKLKVCNSEIF